MHRGAEAPAGRLSRWGTQPRARATGCAARSARRYGRRVTADFVPRDFDPPTTLVTEHFVLEPLGPEHNESDHAAWTSSIAHIRTTPGYPDGSWPPAEGMSLEANRADLERHRADFAARRGFTFTVLEPDSRQVIGCVYLYPSASPEHDVEVLSWVRADRAALDTAVADAVAAWLDTEWPWDRPDRRGR